LSDDRDVRQEELRARLAAGTAPVVIDVRSRAEFRRGRVPGAVNIPFWRFLASWPRVPGRRVEPIVLYCGRGPRAEIAAAVLRWRGRRVEMLDGHWRAWRATPEGRGRT
jgi:rhodanese-related sulfurtransferase